MFALASGAGGGLHEQVRRSCGGAGLPSRCGVETTPGPHPGRVLGVNQSQKALGRNLVRGHDVAVNIEAHRRPRVPRTLGKLPSRDARLVQDRDPAVTEVVRVVVRHLAFLHARVMA